MKIQNITPFVPHGYAHRNATPTAPTDDPAGTRSNQAPSPNTGANGIKQDPTRLPDPARLAPAQIARDLLTVQATSLEGETHTNFGQLVSQIAKDKQASPPEQSTIDPTALLPASPDENGADETG